MKFAWISDANQTAINETLNINDTFQNGVNEEPVG